MRSAEWRHLPGLDQVRGMAVLLVVMGHTWKGPWTVVGGVGVTLFFTLSGYLITGLLLAEHDRTGGIALAAFYLRRARRLLPALVPALALGAYVNHVTGNAILRPVVTSVTYTANYASAGHDVEWASMSHLWSLAVEEHFYVFWPAVVLLAGRRRLVPLCALTVAAIALARYHVSFRDLSLAYRGTQFRVDAMLIGAVLALVPWHPRRWMLAPASACLVWFSHQDNAVAQIRWGVLAVALASGVVILRAAHHRRHLPWLERIGVISYGVYLYHLPVAFLLAYKGVSGPESLFITLVVTLVLAEISYRWYESPIRYGGRPGRSTEGALSDAGLSSSG